MRSAARRTVLTVLAAVLTAALALPASAGQIVEYAGETFRLIRLTWRS